MPDTSSLGKKAGTAGQWVDLPPMSGPLKEPFEIKVYEIDDVERLQRRRQEEIAEVSREGGAFGLFSMNDQGGGQMSSYFRSHEALSQDLRHLVEMQRRGKVLHVPH